MSRNYENKSNHNRSFLRSIDEEFPEEYFDWKVTVQFYVGLHRCYCVLIAKDIEIETSHHSNISNLKAIDSILSQKLFKLFKNSKTSRYDGFLTEEAMLRINKARFEEGKIILNQLETISTNYLVIFNLNSSFL